MRVKHAWQNPRVKASHIPVLHGIVSVRNRIAKTLEFVEKSESQAIDVSIVRGWLKDIDKLDIQGCLKGRFKNATNETKRIEKKSSTEKKVKTSQKKMTRSNN